MATMRRFSHSCEREIMSTVAFPSAEADPQTSAGNAARPTVIRNAQDVSRIVSAGAAKGSNARIVIAIALGGVFLDAYDLTSLAYGIKDIARQFRCRRFRWDSCRRPSRSARFSARCSAGI